MTERVPIYEWAKRYCGDPNGHDARGDAIFIFLRELGLATHHHVLELGCGALSLARPLIRFLDGDRYVGVEPNGWLVEAALLEHSDLAERGPRFLWRSDFDSSELGLRFDFAASHSVLSHAAGWQLPLMLGNVARVLNQGAILLASLRIADHDSNDADWVYQDCSFFSEATVKAVGERYGLRVELLPELRPRLEEAAPGNVHDWLRAIRERE